MEDVDIRYENGCIYMIKHKTDETKDFYIGSSYNFKERCRTHKKSCNNQNIKDYNYKVYKYIRENGGWDCWNIILLYDYQCKNKYQLELEETRAVKEYKSTLNQVIPRRTHQEYYQDNKEKLLQKRKELYEANKEEILEQHKEYYQDNKEKILQQKKEYRKDNKEKISQLKKEHYEANKEEINKKRAIKINCDICNRLVCKDCIARHKRTNYCINYQKSLVDELV
jgi:vacuolar-type H+-ATPase subunit I/STV1